MTAGDLESFGEPRARQMRQSLACIGTAAVAAPLAILLHEFGHFSVGRALGFEAVELHFASVSHNQPRAAGLDWGAAAMSAAGPLVTLGIVAAALALSSRRPAFAPLGFALALSAGIRSVALGIGFLIVQLQHPGATGNFDEFNVAAAVGVSPWLVVAISVIAIVTMWALLVARLASGQRVYVIVSSVLGWAIGTGSWMALIGPVLLP